MNVASKLSRLLPLAPLLLLGCGDAASSAPAALERFHGQLGEVVPTAPHDLIAQHRLAYLDHHGLDLAPAEFRDGFIDAFALGASELAVLDERGFVVVEAPAARRGEAAGPVDTYYRIFAADLPVFITADSILHAWHRSYDELLKQTEIWALRPMLVELASDLATRLDPAREDERDAQIYIGVALVLLEGDESASNPGQRRSRTSATTGLAPHPGSERLAPEARAIAEAIASPTIGVIDLAGRERPMDFSQFVPRGHYADSRTLRSYFRAMMWLGRAELFVHDPAEAASEHRPAHATREERAALALARAIAESELRGHYEAIETFLERQIGAANGLSPRDLIAICARAGVEGCTEPSPRLRDEVRRLEPVAHASRLGLEPAESSRAVVALRMFPQRFAYDAWVTAKTTSPELDPLPVRTMASPLDVAFALGADRAAEHLYVEMLTPGRQKLPAALARVRSTMQRLRPVELEPSVYNHWLEALMALSEPRLASEHPRVMQTAAWHDRQLEALLGGWTELRHDTVLVVEQSLGRMGCQYPKGYVEPIPDLYRALAAAAARLAPLHAPGGAIAAMSPHDVFAGARAYLEQFQGVMQRLADLAERQLAGQPMKAADLAFLEHTVDRHHEGYAGIRRYDGWYPRLFWTPQWWDSPHAALHSEGASSRPVVSDVHTDAFVGKVLQVGVSHPEMIIVAIDDPAGEVALYGGPVTSFYSFESELSGRMTDNEWRDRVARGALPPRPVFARAYRP